MVARGVGGKWEDESTWKKKKKKKKNQLFSKAHYVSVNSKIKFYENFLRNDLEN